MSARQVDARWSSLRLLVPSFNSYSQEDSSDDPSSEERSSGDGVGESREEGRKEHVRENFEGVWRRWEVKEHEKGQLTPDTVYKGGV